VASWLRERKGLTGTKIVCAEGDCGACTILVCDPSKKNKLNGHVFEPVNACILPLLALDACYVLTIEGVGSIEKPDPVQTAMVENHGAQCGYCTPGIVCALVGLTNKTCQSEKGRTTLDEKTIRNHLTGNLCRCTGYEPIIRAGQSIDLSKTPRLIDRPGFATAMGELSDLAKQSLRLLGPQIEIFSATTIAEALELKRDHPEVSIVGGATDLGVVANKREQPLRKIMSLKKISDLHRVKIDSTMVTVGACLTMSELENQLPNDFCELKNFIKVFASPQIKNSATLVGNLVNGSPIGDMIPALMALDAQLEIASAKGLRQVPLSEFYLGYKKKDLKLDEIVQAVRFRRLRDKAHFFRTYKVANRKDLDISVVSLAGLMELDWAHRKIVGTKFSLGGVAEKVIRLEQQEKQLAGLSLDLFSDESQKEAFLKPWIESIVQQIAPLTDVRGSSQYRKILVRNLLGKFFFEFADFQDGSDQPWEESQKK
jgi:xanthine dehydrogenase small subunit